MKKLTQDDFKNEPAWVRSLAVDADGAVYRFALPKVKLIPDRASGMWSYYRLDSNDIKIARIEKLGDGYDATNWHYSAIDRMANESP